MGKNNSRLKSRNSFRNVHRACVISIVVLLYVLVIFAGLYQELNIYMVESNTLYLRSASSIIGDEKEVASSVLAGVEHTKVKVPMGMGNFVALFYNEDGDMSSLWVVNEMSLWDSIRAIFLFTFLDIVVFLITLNIIKKYFGTYKWRICALSVYQIVAIMASWAVHSYCWSVLFGKSAVYVSGVYTVIRLLTLSCVMAMYDKSQSIKEKKTDLVK